MSYDYLVVGAGFAGSVMARQLADAGKRVLVVEKRDHIGGNAYDYVNEHGVRIHKYGPHIFHTNSDAVFEYLSRFTEWRPYEHRVLASVEGKLVPFPVNLTTLEMLGLTREDCAPDESITHPRNAEEQCLQRVGRKLYELFFEGYTTKMWGVHPRELDASVTARIPVRWDSRDDRYFTDKHQAMPKGGYTAMFGRMLDHPNITLLLRSTSAPNEHKQRGLPLIWTGPIDKYFGHCFGPLPYRSMRFDLVETYADDRGHRIPAPVFKSATTNFPATSGMRFQTDMALATRETRMVCLLGNASGGTDDVLVTEYPQAEGDPYYPISAPENTALYKRYEALADAQPDVHFVGRLARYQYLNMDQVVGQALATFRRLQDAGQA